VFARIPFSYNRTIEQTAVYRGHLLLLSSTSCMSGGSGGCHGVHELTFSIGYIRVSSKQNM
jgi:hypothetical protein